jgi:hypothetical protein
MKTCSGCNISQSEENFSWQKKSEGKRYSRCKTCKSADAKERWASGKDKESNYRSKAKRLNSAREYLWKYLCEHPCIDCGESDPIVLELDHIANNKFLDVSTMIISNYSLDRIRAEIEKCEVVCCNCHRRRTSMRGNHWRSTK